jgi:integrase
VRYALICRTACRRERGSTICATSTPRRFAANLNPKVIQARLGHATIIETMDTYGHLFPDAEDLGRGAIDAIFVVARTEQGRNQEM